MKTNQQLFKAIVLGILCAGLSSATAQNNMGSQQNSSPQDQQKDSQSGTSNDQNGNNTYDTRLGNRNITGTPTTVNRGSELIGMEVHNANNERLGKISDIVIDLQSGRVSYVVLDAGTIFESKLFAVPLDAFAVSANQKHLILNSDKTRMASAQGFDKSAWPDVNNPAWGANNKFWDQPTDQQPSSSTSPGQMKNSEPSKGSGN